MKYLLLICADEDAEAVFPGDAAQAAGLERADLEPDEAAEGHQKVRFGSVDVRPVWWREAA